MWKHIQGSSQVCGKFLGAVSVSGSKLQVHHSSVHVRSGATEKQAAHKYYYLKEVFLCVVPAKFEFAKPMWDVSI